MFFTFKSASLSGDDKVGKLQNENEVLSKELGMFIIASPVYSIYLKSHDPLTPYRFTRARSQLIKQKS